MRSDRGERSNDTPYPRGAARYRADVEARRPQPRLAPRTIGIDAAERTLKGKLLEVAAELPGRSERLGRFLTHGKCLRGRLALLAAAALGRDPTPRAIRVATAIELIHAGALCHDDVVDRSHARRGEPTLLATWGATNAVRTGLFLILRAATLLVSEPAAVRMQVARAVREVARGQTDELADLFVETVSPDDYLRRARAKTGALYELAGRLGAAAGELPARTADAIARYAAETGMAFQLVDDLRDFSGGEALGREAGTDLREGVFTFPVLLTLSGRREGGDELRRILARPWSADVLHRCIALLHANGAFDATWRRACDALAAAVGALRSCPPTPAVHDLAALARSVPTGVFFSIGPVGSTGTPRRPRFPPLLAHLVHVVRKSPMTATPTRVRDHWTGVADTLLHLTDALDRSPNDAALVGVIDLLVGDLFELLARASAADAVSAVHALTSRLRDALADSRP